MTLSLDDIYAATDATWAPARRFALGPFILREGQGGGGRVSSATTAGVASIPEIFSAEGAMRDLRQTPRFQMRAGNEDLDQILAEQGYVVADETVLYGMPIKRLMDVKIPPVTTFCVWEPLAIMREIWAKGGITEARLAVMERAQVKTGIFARWNEKPAGVAFAAVHNGICMVHAVEVLQHQRRQGVGVWLMRQAAFWGHQQGAHSLALMTTRANTGANGLYQSLGFAQIGSYHYRLKQDVAP